MGASGRCSRAGDEPAWFFSFLDAGVCPLGSGKEYWSKTYFAVHAYAGREGGVASTAFRFVLRGGTECTIRVC